MVDRILIDDFSPINHTIILTPAMLESNHAKLIEDSIVYELMAKFIFHEFDRNLSNVDDEVYDLLNPNNYKKLETGASEIEVSESAPSYDSSDYKRYISHFLEVIENQNLLDLYSSLTRKELLKAKDLFSPELKSNLRNFRIEHLLNQNRYNRALKYDVESVETKDRYFIDYFLNSNPIIYDNLKKHINFTKTKSSFITVNSSAYMLELLKQQNLIPRRSDSLGELKVGKVKKNKETVNLSAGRKKPNLQTLKVQQDKVIFEGMFLNKTTDDIIEIIEGIKEVKAKVESLKSQNLDIMNSSNPIKSAIISALTPKRGKLGVGEVSIKVSLPKKFGGSDLYAKDGIKENSIINILSSMGYKRERLKTKKPEEVETFRYESPQQIKDRAKLEAEAEAEGETLIELPDVKEVLPKEGIPLAVISDVYIINDWVIDFSITKGTFLDVPKREDKLGGKKEREERRESAKGKEYDMKDISTMGRLKSAYRALERMVDRFV